MWPAQILDGPAWERLSWTLWHFLWQGFLIAAGVEVLLALLPLRQAAHRYALLTLGLALMALCPLVTFLALDVARTTVTRETAVATSDALAGPFARQPAAPYPGRTSRRWRKGVRPQPRKATGGGQSSRM